MRDPRPSETQPGYASVLVPVDLGPGAASRIRFAGALADLFAARLIGVGGRDFSLPLYGGDVQPIAVGLIEEEQRRVEEDLKAAERLFRDAAGGRNEPEWRHAICPPAFLAAEQARAADIVVVGRRGADDPSGGTMEVHPGDLVMEAGRPLLMVPPDTIDFAPRRVVVAWKDTREARRAVWDSLPLLRLAQDTTVVSVLGAEGKGGADDVAAYLKRHGVADVSTVALTPDHDGGEAGPLVRFAKRERADLIVAGAYGHSRLREWLFGGVTRHLLREAPVPCLLAH